MSEILERNVRREDTLARLGGEEFLVILPRINQQQVARFGERLRKVVEQNSTVANPATISLGAATYTFTSKRAALKRIMKQLISEADRAMYQSKHAGRNCFTHFADLSNSNK